MLEEFPDATIFRPAEIYGEGDTFINYYLNGHNFSLGRRGYWGNMAFYRKGNYTSKRPLFAPDLASGIMAALETPGEHKLYC